MPNNKKLAVILGAHRSGTSLCAASVECLGVNLNIKGNYSNEENKKGFFEQTDIVSFNNQLLSFLGGSWDNFLFDGASAIANADIKAWHAKATKLLLTIFKDTQFAAIKDPRMCQLLSFWKPVFQDCGYLEENIYIIYILRDPVEVALSQQLRANDAPAFYEIGKNVQEGAILWLTLTAQALRQSMKSNNYILSYHALLNESEREIRKLAKYLGLSPENDQIASFCHEFVDTTLYRSRSNLKAQEAVTQSVPQILEFYNKLKILLKKRQFGFREIKPILKSVELLKANGVIDVAIPVISRLSESCRKDRSIALQNKAYIKEINAQFKSLTDDRDQMKLAYENEKVLMVKEQAAAVESQTQEIARLDSDSGELQAQLKALSDDRDQMKLAYENEKALMVKEQAAAVESQTQEVARLESGSGELQAQLKVLSEDRDQMKLAYENEKKLLIEQHAEIAESMKDKVAEVKAEKCVIQDELKILVAEKEQLLHTIALLKSSISWKITVPLRMINSKFKKLKHLPAKYWLLVNRLSHNAYAKLFGYSPWLANFLRSLMLPVFGVINQIILGSSYLFTVEKTVNITSDTRMQLDYQLPCSVELYQPLVSIVVPNYNHAKFLRQRLDSIYSQSYKYFEVILMDDCSKDESSIILQEYKERYSEKTCLILNDKNSGGVFYQWEKGLKLARGDIIWMAESDDWCTENFLETLVPFFQNEGVQLAYTKTIFMDASGKKQIWSINEYLHDIDPNRWNHAFVETAHKLVGDSFAIKNIVPNVSSALFRNPTSLEILKQEEWKTMRTCGDWVLYLHLIRGGLVAYSPDAHNYYRIHDNNTSVISYAEDSFYIEHEAVAKTIQRYFNVDQSVFDKQYSHLVTHWKQTRPTFSKDAFERCYSLARIKKEATTKTPNMIMAGFAFCAGGGETFPIQLANLMKSKGYNVTFLDCAQEPRVEKIRQSLRMDIPVISNYADLQRIVENFGIDLIHSHHAWVDNTILNILPEDTDCKTIVTLHGMYETIASNSLKTILPRLVERSAKIIYTAEKNLTALRKNKLIERADPVRIDNALEITPVDPFDRSLLGISEDAFLLTLVSRAIPEKGWLEAIEAVALAREQSGKDIHLILIGEGPVYNDLKKKRLPFFIHIEGFRMNIRSYFFSSQMGFLPSRFHGESFPLVIIDCLQVGRPVLASSVGEISYMLGTKEGLAGDLFDLNNWKIPISNLANHIARLATDSHYYCSLLGKARIAAKKFDPELLKENYHTVYSSVLSTAKHNAD